MSSNKNGNPAEQGHALLIGLIIVVMAVGAYLIFSSQKSGPEEVINTNTADQTNNSEADFDEAATNTNFNASVENAGNDTAAESEVKTFTLTAKNFSFDPAEIKVKKGDKVKIILNNVEGFHDWVVDEFNASTKRIQGPSSDTVEFIADKTGIFEYYCSIGEHRAMGMKGNLIVE